MERDRMRGFVYLDVAVGGLLTFRDGRRRP